MKIEYLFSEHCNLFADSSNIKYLSQCLKDATIYYTHFTEEPKFLNEKVDLVYLGAMTEDMQEKVIQKLLPYKEQIKTLIDDGLPILATSNAIEIFGKTIEKDDHTKIEALGLFNFDAKCSFKNRKNSLVLGTFDTMKIIGFKTQFSLAYSDDFEYPFIQVEKGLGMNEKSKVEGIHYKNFFGTYLVGPFLVLNPLFTKYLLSVMGAESQTLAFEEAIMDAYQFRLGEFENPKTKF